MIYLLLDRIDRRKPFPRVSAHCDIPCKIYDPHGAQIAALSVVRFLDLMTELMGKKVFDSIDHVQLSRLTREKEIHAEKVKDEVRVLWGDYFKTPQLERFPDTPELVHKIMLKASACKQQVDRTFGLELLDLVNELASRFWSTKSIDSYVAKCPYPPELDVVYPKLA